MTPFRSVSKIRFLLSAALAGTGVWLTALASYGDGAAPVPLETTPVSGALTSKSQTTAIQQSASTSLIGVAAAVSSTSTLFVAAVEQFGVGSGQVDLFNVTLGGSGAADAIATASPATLAITNSTNENKPDVDNPLNTLFDSSGDLLIGNGGTTTGSPPDYGNFACVPAGAILTGNNSATTVTPNVNDPVGIAYDPRDGSAGLSNNPTSAAIQLAEYIVAAGGGYQAAPSPRNLTTPGYGSFGLTNIPALAAGTYAIGLTDGLENDPAHSGTGKSKIAILSPTGAETDISDTSTFAIDVPHQIAWDSTNSQLVIANFSTWHRLLSFYTVSPIAQVKTINTGHRMDKVAVSPDGHVAVSWNTSFGTQQVQVYDGTAARNPVGGPIPFNGTTTSCGSTYVNGGSNGGAVNSLTWLSNTKLLVAVQVYNGSNAQTTNGLYIYDISATAVPPGYDDVSCSAFAAAPKQTGFVHINNKPLAAAFRPFSVTYADPAGTCSNNAPCFNSINTAIAATPTGGIVNVLGGTFHESVNINSNVIVNLDANTMVNDLTISAGTLNAAGGSCGQTNAATLTLAVGNWSNNGGTFNAVGGKVVFSGTSAQSIGGSSSTTFADVTVNNASGVNLTLSQTIGGTLSLTSGALRVGTNTLTLNGAVTATSGSITSSPIGTVNYNQGSNGQGIAPGNYGNLTFSNFTKTLPSTGTVNIAGIFTTGATGGHTVTGSTIGFNGAGGQTLPANFATYNNLTINNGSGVTLGGSVTVNGGLTLTNGNITTGANVLAIGAGGTRSRTSGYILGNEKKTYSTNVSFTYDVGTANGYSPVDATITAGTGDLTAVAVQGAEPSVVATRSLARYWTLTKGGAGVTANLTFHYLDPTDIMGNENNYQPLQVSSGARTYYINNCPNTCDNPAANTFSVAGVTNFSDFTAGEARADLQIMSVNDSPDPVIAGNNITYTINVINNGPDSSSNVTVTDAVPANTTFVSASFPAGWSRTDVVATGGTGSIVFTKATVASAESGTLQMVVYVNSSALGGSSISDAAVVASAITTDPLPGNETGNASTLIYTVPTITSANNATFVVGTTGSFTVTTTGYPLPSVTRGGVTLPNGITFTSNGDGTGTLSGKPSAGTGGTYAISFTANNAAGSSAAQSFTLTVDEAPSITSANRTTFTTETAGAFNVIATGYPSPTINLTNGSLPNGVNYGNGSLAGTPTVFGTFPLTFTASNGIGSNAVQNFSLLVNPSAQDVKSKSRISENPSGGLRMDFLGNPGQQYTVQWSATLTSPSWQTLELKVADANGMFFSIDTPPAGTTQRFYRAIVP